MLKKKKIRSKKHRKFISGLPCCACGSQGRTQAAHIRIGNEAGVGLKSGDDCIVPLCCSNGYEAGCHDEQGHLGEKKFWGQYGCIERATRLAKKLYEVSGDKQGALELIARFRR